MIGALAFAVGALTLVAAALFTAGSTRTDGTVVRVEGEIGNGRRDYGEPDVVRVVRYAGPGGVMHELRGMVVRESSAYPVGMRVPVRYQRLADGTLSARIDETGEIWGVPAAFALFGVAFLAAGVGARRVALRGGGR